MAQIIQRVSGRPKDSVKREAKTFSERDAPLARAYANRLADVETSWYVRVRLNGKLSRKRFASRKDAVAFANDFESEKRRGLALDPNAGRIPFDAFALDWLASNPAKRGSTLARDRSIVERHLIPKLGATPLRAVTEAGVQRLVREWELRYAASTVARHYTCLQAIFSEALRRREITRTPCSDIKIPSRGTRTSLILTPEQVVRLAEKVGEYSAMVFVGAVLGLRWGEVAGLRTQNVNLEAHTIQVETQLTRGEHGRMVAGPPKSQAGRRTFQIPVELTQILHDHIVANEIERRDAYLFTATKGAPLHYSNWRRRVWVPATESLGFATLRFHDLRHVAATALVLSGVDIKTAEHRLGHSTPQVTLALYAQVTPAADKAAAESLGSHFFPTSSRQNRAKPRAVANTKSMRKAI